MPLYFSNKILPLTKLRKNLRCNLLNKALAYHWIMQKIIVAVRKESAEDMALKIVTR